MALCTAVAANARALAVLRPRVSRNSSTIDFARQISVARFPASTATAAAQTQTRRSQQPLATPITPPNTRVRFLRSLAELESMEKPAAATPSRSELPASANAAATSEAVIEQQPHTSSFILTLSCPDRKSIVHLVTGFLAQRGFNIRDSAQFGDSTTKRFFMRVHAEADVPFSFSQAALRAEFERETGLDALDFEFHNAQERPRTLIMVSKIGHCLNDLLFRVSSGSLPIDVPVIVSNHNEYAALAKAHNIPFVHLPIDTAAGKTKQWQEDEILKLCAQYNVDLVVLARYMQVRARYGRDGEAGL